MKIEKRDGSRERRILTGMITDATVLSRIASKWEPKGLFRADASNLIASWCIDYYKQYGTAPGKAVEVLYESWTESSPSEATVKAVESFLSGLSGEYEALAKEVNSAHLIDQAAKHFTYSKLTGLQETLESALTVGNLEKAETVIQKYSRVEMGTGSGVALLQDREAVSASFQKNMADALVEYPGDLGDFLGHAMERDGFIVFTAPQKVGKTFALLDVAWRAMLQRRRVAYFQVGDMSESQIIVRFMERASRHPHRSPNRKWPCTLELPKSITHSKGEDLPRIERNYPQFEKPLNGKIAWAACETVMKNQVRSKSPYFKLTCYPVSGVNVLGIKSVLEQWANDGWVADIVVIDYSDNLAPIDPHEREAREKVNATWRQLRALSQTQHCLLVTATQTNAAGFSEKVLTRKNFSEDNRKLNHVTGMIGLNQTEKEKEIGVVRWNWIVAREQGFSPYRCCYAAGNLAIASPTMKSCWQA